MFSVICHKSGETFKLKMAFTVNAASVFIEPLKR